jgi:ATP-dependent Clp protease ATP-binding subunit ClpC
VDEGIAVVLFYVVLFLVIFAIARRKQIRAWWQRRRAKAAVASGSVDLGKFGDRLIELEKTFGPFGSNAAHPSALLTRPDFIEATQLLAAPAVSINSVLQYVEGNNWALSSAALVALRKRADATAAVDRVLLQCEYYSPWTMYFALEFITNAKPRLPVGAPAAYAKEWWIDNRWMLNIFRDYFSGCAERQETVTFGSALTGPKASAVTFIRRFLANVTHPYAAALIKEIDDNAPKVLDVAPSKSSATLNSVGRYWGSTDGSDTLIEPGGWREAFALAEAALHQNPPRSLLISGESMVGKTSFLWLLAQRLSAAGWSVFEAGGADLQAGQVYIGELEGRIRKVIEELDSGHKTIWYIPDILQLAMSGRHLGQSATMLDQIIPAIAAGRVLVWCEATPKGVARLLQIKPSLRGLLETVTIEPLSQAETLPLVNDVLDKMSDASDIHFDADCAKVALETASQYLGSSGLPGSVLLMLKLTAARVGKEHDKVIEPLQVLETLSQLSGLPVSILDTKGQLDLKSVRDFFAARVIGQDEAVEAVVDRIAMLKAGLSDPDKPIAVFLFAGPTGTGKTELAKAVSEFLFGTVERMIRLDMSEFQMFESVSKILGQSNAAADTDSLISRVRKQPFSVILLDEFEKSHPNIWDLFLQAFDEGRLTDAMGQVADLRHCIIIMTSNLGATAHQSLGLGFAPRADAFSKEQVLRAISQTYRPEFQNRLDKVIVFQPLTRDLMRSILKKELAALLDRRGLKDRTWAIEWESSALEFLLAKGFSQEMGARPLKRAIDEYLIAPLAGMIVEKRFPEGEQFLFVRSDGKGIQVEFVDPDADSSAPAFAAVPEASSRPDLASVILVPQGTAEEFQCLQADYDDIQSRFGSLEWEELKSKLTKEMASADFWNRADRFGTLARVALMDRVKHANETAEALHTRLARYARSPRGYSAELCGRLALQLHVVNEGIKDVFDDSPVEIVLTVEPVFDGGNDHRQSLAWCRRLMAMYRAWAGKRRMQFHDISENDSTAPVGLVSGFGACRALSPEAGLHVFEESENADKRATARVRFAAVPLGDIPAVKESALIRNALEGAPKANTIVRRYREKPPLVRDAAAGWRTGRLELVLGGDFDLIGATHKQ